MTTDFSLQPPPSNPYLNPNPEIHFYTENFKEFPIIVPNSLPFFPVAIYKIAIIKSVEQLILTSISNANGVAKEFLNRYQLASNDLKQSEESIQYSLIKPTAHAMQHVMNIQCFQQQLCWILSEFNNKSGLNVPIEQIATVANILVDENVTSVLEQVASKSCKSVYSLIQDLIKESISKQNQNQSMQSAKVIYGSYLSPTSPSILSSSFLLPEKVSPYSAVKNIPPEYSHARAYTPSFNDVSPPRSPSEFILPLDYSIEY
uniref:Uncharacterized protein n=1 Tax=Panagrolaimus sp. ES5 TaxID=591445 RepID=A0AC34FG79_9BILA